MNTGPVELASALRALLRELNFMPTNFQLGDCESLFAADILDSLRLMELVTHIEKRFGIRVGAQDLIPEHFDSIDCMSRYMADQSKQPS